MNTIKTLGLGTLLIGTIATSLDVSANTVRYEGLYQMDPGCKSITLQAGIGYGIIDPTVDLGSLTIDTIGQTHTQSITMSCEDATLDEAEVIRYQEEASKACKGLVIPGKTADERAEFCDDLAVGAVDSLRVIADYFLSELVYSIDVDIVADSWFGGTGSMFYTFDDGRNEYRRPFVANNGWFYRGITGNPDTPNPLGCPTTRIGTMTGNMDLSSGFPGGARMYTNTNIADGVVCPVADIFNQQIVVAAYGFTINIKQQGDRL